MKSATKSYLTLLLTLALLALPATAHAEGQGRLRLGIERPQLAVGQKVTVEVLVESAPTIYGADVHITFDPGILKVVDADEALPGVQLQPGDLLAPEKSFFLQHHADNEAGTIDYALALLNPAPPVEGDGLLLRVTFEGKAEGLAVIAISEGQFGTRTGETIQPELDQLDVRVGDAAAHTRPGESSAVPVVLPGEKENRFILNLTLLIGGLSIAGLACIGGGGWIWFRHARQLRSAKTRRQLITDVDQNKPVTGGISIVKSD